MVQPKPYNGLFITLEGGDGCGKTVLAHALDKELTKRGYVVFRTREPGGTPLSEHLRELVLNPDSFEICERAEMMLYLTARVQNLHDCILPALRAGKVVLCDRFNDSTIAYQACARHLGKHQVEQLCHLVCDGIEPDVTLLLDTSPEIGLSRVKDNKDRLEQEKIQFHEEVRQGYLRLADQHPERIILIDAALPEAVVFKKAMEALEPKLVVRAKHGS